MNRVAPLALLALAATGCAEVLLAPDPDGDPVAVFDELWGEFDRYYSHFEIKGVDWAAVGARYRPQVTPATTAAGLFQVLSGMLGELRDGHVNLWAPFAGYGWDGWYAGYPESFDPSRVDAHLSDRRTAEAHVRWGRIAPDLGYLWIPSFGDRTVIDGVDAALAGLGGVAGLVVDVRHNGGGTDNYAVAVAGRFTDRARHYRTVRYRNGPAHDDFTAPRQDSVRPDGVHYAGPVALLTNRRVFSAAEDFVLAMRALPQVTVVGDTTGGGAGNPITRELSNGWVYRIPRWIVLAPDGTSHEGVGLAPEVFVQFDPADATVVSDPVLDSALARLRS